MASVAAILLAAGESARMGQPKALLPWCGSPLLEYQASSLSSAGIGRIIVVLGHRSEELVPLLEDRPALEWVYNRDYLIGKTTSLKAGLRALGDPSEEAILVLNVDQPRSAAVIATVTEEHLRHRNLITVPCYQGRGGHPILLSTSLLPELMDITEESQGLKTVVRRHEVDTCRVVMETSQVLLDLNTPDDYQRALKAIEEA